MPPLNRPHTICFQEAYYRAKLRILEAELISLEEVTCRFFGSLTEKEVRKLVEEYKEHVSAVYMPKNRIAMTVINAVRLAEYWKHQCRTIKLGGDFRATEKEKKLQKRAKVGRSNERK